MKVNFFDAAPFPKTCDVLLGGFWGAKILKSEQNFKNIQKFAKRSLTNTFGGILIIYYKGRKQL